MKAKCRNCGSELNPRSKYCRRCGARVGPEVEPEAPDCDRASAEAQPRTTKGNELLPFSRKGGALGLAAVGVVLLIGLAVLAAHWVGASTSASSAVKRTVVVSQPANASVIVGGQAVPIEVQASGQGSPITSVEIQVNGAPFQTLTVAPFSVSWSPVSAGNFQIEAVAKDSAGNSAQSAPIMVTVKAAADLTSGASARARQKTSDGLSKAGFWGVWGTASRTAAGVTSSLQKLKAEGFPAGVVRTTDWGNLNSSPWYAVYIGPYSSRPEADTALSQARSAGHVDFYVKFSGPSLR